MNYKVYFTLIAERDIELIVDYLSKNLNNQQAADCFLDNLGKAIKLLEYSAESFQLCTAKRYNELGYRKLYLENSKYFMLYRIKNNEVFIDEVLHQLQGFERKIH